ncbi:hypothetical protein [Conexibacter sp. CPCC 206217]|uniref:hypothetical protein n=1 Tax=Conexibacter sp. CPCC 206217 TaxID=3064574 RepID=UPI0027270892|nr:hypothetical protein [Conexibacter sp. CPCC 206217]MDO8211371.1 hypothetical protein [Conexibacter sp. CPCC 206217]
MKRRLHCVALVCAGALLAQAAPSFAASCENLALPVNGGLAEASSENSNGLYPVAGVNDGIAQTSGGRGFWSDDTPGVFPDWVQIRWDQPTTINRLVFRIAVSSPALPLGVRTQASTRIQYWDDSASAWVDVVGRSGQANPIVGWTSPLDAADGSERRQFDFPDVTTTKVRALIEDGASDGASWMEEIEAYRMTDDCDQPDENLALASNGGIATASTTNSNGLYPVRGVNDGVAQTSGGLGFWSDDTSRVFPDWVQISWADPVVLNRLVFRIPVVSPSLPVGIRTLARTRIQYWDEARSDWVDVVGRSGQDNPILDWIAPLATADGSERREFTIPEITTTKIRAVIEDGATDGASWMEEIEAYGRRDAARPPAQNLALVDNGGSASASSTHSSGLYPVSALNDDRRESGSTRGYWNDDTQNDWSDDWAQIGWTRPVTLDRVVVRIPIAQPDFPVGEITLRSSRVQYWDEARSAWTDVVGASGQSNPILDWTGPIGTTDGSETRTFDIDAITTTKVRVLIEDGSTDGWSWLDEIEAWGWDA